MEGRRQPRDDGSSSGKTEATSELDNLTIRTPGRTTARAANVPPNRTPTIQAASSSRPGAGPTSSGGAPQTSNGFSASARRLRATSATKTATPHARRAIEVMNDRRTAIFNTPGRPRRTLGGDNNKRRASQGGPDLQKDGPLNALRHLSRRLAPLSERVVASSSPRDGSSVGAESAQLARDPSGIFIDDDDDDDDSGFIERRPRLSLPIDAGDDDEAELRPPRTSGLENIIDDTVMSIEAPRRAISEQPFRRMARDRDSLRMSDYFADGQEDFTVDVGQDSFGPIPPAFDADGDTFRRDDDTYERLDSPIGRQEAMAAGRQSDFGIIEVPLGVDSPFRLEPVPQDSSDLEPLPPPDFDDGDDGSPAPQMIGDSDIVDYDDVFATAANAAGPGFEMGNDVDGFEDIEDADDMVDGQPDEQVVSAKSRTKTGKKKAGLKVTKFGLPCPSLPPSVVKRLAETMARTSGIGNAKISPETLQALMQATEWFFEQMGEDLRALSHHAGRKTIDQSDVIALMKRQRQIDSQTTLFSLAQRHLPRELLQELRMPVRAAPKKRRKAAAQPTSDDER